MSEKTATWVVYWMTLHNKRTGMRAVCKQSEWDAMELIRPGYHHLIRAGIATEVEAEALARSEPTAAETQVRAGPTLPEGRNLHIDKR